MELSKRKRSTQLFEDYEKEIKTDVKFNDIINNMNNIDINNNNSLLYQLNLKMEDLEKKIEHIFLVKKEENNELHKKIEYLNKKIDDIFRDKEYTIDKLNEEINYLKAKINEYENCPKYNNSNDYFL